jgi:tetratricopeptide (TPR) repeat protein
VRAANAALSGGEPRSALDLTTRAAAAMDSAAAARTVLPLMVRALTELGQPTEAEQRVNRYRAWLAPDQRAQLVRLIAWGWVRAGDIARARESLRDAGAAGADSLAGEDVAAGWIALYEGDLKTARTALRRSGETAPDLVSALAVLARTRAERAPVTGQAFLLLARGDSARAAAKFVEAARELADAAPLLLATAARVHAARRDDDRAVALWQVIVAGHAAAPEAAEADLEWARVLRRRGQSQAAIERLEHLILTYPQSALVPQARRELDLVRRSVPPASE